MSCVRFNISDRDTCIHGDLHGSFTDPLIASLTAEPETISEFESALNRFLKPESDWPIFSCFKKYECLEPYDAGVVAIDLASRTVGYETTYSLPHHEGSVRVPSEFADGPEDVYVPYRVPDDWMFVETIPLYEGTRLSRCRQRAARPPADTRAVLFGSPMIEFIARAICESRDPNVEDAFADIHAEWLMTTRTDLENRSPRDVLFEKKDFIDFDLHSRSLQWSFTKVCPPGLSEDSFAYRYAGFGTHEWVLYYDLIRHLLADSAAHRATALTSDVESEVPRLTEVANRWLSSPDSESWGRLPREIMDLERRRINLTATAAEILIDENCPCCVALAQDFDTPMFTHLDGCNMDDRFEFSPFKTIEEYQEDIRQREEFHREWEAKRKENPGFEWEDTEGAPF